MNASVLLVAIAFATDPALDTEPPIYSLSPHLAAAIRAQTPTYEELPESTQPPTPAYTAPAWPGLFGRTPTYDPFLGQPSTAAPSTGAPRGYSFGVNGPQPYRFGWTSRYDAAVLPKAETRGRSGFGQMGIFEFNAEWEHTTPQFLGWSGWIFSSTPQFNLRAWDGPPTGGSAGLPGSVFRFGWDLELATPAAGAWSVQLGFTPAIASDLQRSLSSNAWNFDGRGILFYQYTPDLMFAFGAAFWDRVNDRVVPYAGLVWTPDDRWEYRLLFPQPRVSYFLGNIDGFAKWIYVSGEYHVEAYEIEMQPISTREQIELEDWRLMLGLRMEQNGFTAFIEAGWVLGRNVDFLNGTPDFDIASGFLGRIGLRY